MIVVGRTLAGLRARALCVLLALFSLHATADELGDKRQQYLAALRSLDSGQIEAFQAAKAALTDYPLYPYLDYQDHLLRLNHLTPADGRGIPRTLERFADRRSLVRRMDGRPRAPRRMGCVHHPLRTRRRQRRQAMHLSASARPQRRARRGDGCRRSALAGRHVAAETLRRIVRDVDRTRSREQSSGVGAAHLAIQARSWICRATLRVC
jgi:hypothetical protein